MTNDQNEAKLPDPTGETGQSGQTPDVQPADSVITNNTANQPAEGITGNNTTNVPDGITGNNTGGSPEGITGNNTGGNPDDGIVATNTAR